MQAKIHKMQYVLVGELWCAWGLRMYSYPTSYETPTQAVGRSNGGTRRMRVDNVALAGEADGGGGGTYIRGGQDFSASAYG
jgi:hypothetical protein